MGESRSTKSLSPHSVAAVASTLVLVVGLGLGVYFVELRGPGLRAALAGNQAQEILTLFGAIAAIAMTGHFAIANAVRQSRASQSYRRLVHRALELDHTDPAALRQFEVVPELRDLVSSLMAEKSQTRELSDQIETLRGEMRGLLQGMERSVLSLGALRQEQSSDLGQRVSGLWNKLVERVQAAEKKAAHSAVGAEKEVAVESATANFAFTNPETSQVDSGVQARVLKLESEVERLWATVESLPAQTTQQVPAAAVTRADDNAFVDATPAFAAAMPVPEPRDLKEATPPDVAVSDARAELTAIEDASDGFSEDPLTMTRSSSGVPSVFPEPSQFVEPKRGWEAESAPGRSHFGSWSGKGSVRDADGNVPESIWGATDEPVTPSEAHPSGFGSAKKSAPLPTGGFTEEAFTPTFGSDVEEGVESTPSPPQSSAEPSFEDLKFPHFVGKPVIEAPDLVKVTYENSSVKAEELPESSLLFEPEEGDVDESDPIVDLRSLGAVEFKE